VLTVSIFCISYGCRTAKPFTCVWYNPLDYAYDSLINRDTIEVKNIKVYIKYIDSLSENDESQKFLVKSIVEGKINQETVKTSNVRHNNKIDTIRTTKSGGFGKYTTENIKGDTVYKIFYHDNIDKNYYETHYFEDNKLVYSKIDYQENGIIGKTFYYKEEYYKDKRVLMTNESSKSIEKQFRKRVNFDLQRKGNYFFAEFQAKR
jgi:predicted lactoylglutathione lyase